MSRLWWLDRESNQLTGAIPPELGQLTTLLFLRMGGNSLTGNLPGTFSNLTSLRMFRLANNSLTGVIPLPVAQLLGVVESRGPCYLNGNAGLELGGGPAYRAADLNRDCIICTLGFTR